MAPYYNAYERVYEQVNGQPASLRHTGNWVVPPWRVVGNVSASNPNGMTERYDVCGVTSFPIIRRGITSKPHNEIDIWLSYCIQGIVRLYNFAHLGYLYLREKLYARYKMKYFRNMIKEKTCTNVIFEFLLLY